MTDLILPSIKLVGHPGEALDSGCFLGGAPQLPADLTWPRDGAGRPLVHLAQIDLASLPQEVHVGDAVLPLPSFPRTGTLFVFAACADDELYEMEPGTFAILHTDRDVRGLAPVQPPADAPVLGPYAAVAHSEPWSDLRRHAPEALDLIGPPRIYPRVPLSPVADVTAGSAAQLAALARAVPARALPEHPAAQLEAWQAELAARQPALAYAVSRRRREPVPDWLPKLAAQMTRMQTDGDGNPIRHDVLPETVPWTWGALGRIVLHLWAEVAGAKARGRLVRRRSSECVIADFWGDRLPETCRAWAQEAAPHGPADLVPPERAAAFVALLKSLDSDIPEVTFKEVVVPRAPGSDEMETRRVAPHTFSEDYDDNWAQVVLGQSLRRALFKALEGSWPEIVAAGAPADMPEPVATHLSSVNHASPHRMFGAGHSIQGAPERMADHLLLLELDSDRSANLMWGDTGVLQLWIAPADLADSRFDRAVATVESC